VQELHVGNEVPSPLERVEVTPDAHDEQIKGRLAAILEATGWFVEPRVRVKEGVAFLDGETHQERYRDWASALAQRTEGVVAVVNNITTPGAAFTDLSPALEGLEALWNGLARTIPFMIVGALLLVVAYFAGRGATWAARASVRRRNQPDLIRELTARAVGVLVFTLGLYLALRVAGLTRLAATVLGGTGILGLVLGIAFRDMAENLLASLLLTRQQPFSRGDLVEIAGTEGYVQRLTARATILVSLDGNHIQIPNATVYKSAIRNFTSNPTRRIDFVVGIGYDESIAHAQQVALAVLSEHPAVLTEPEPWVLAENLGSAVVNLRVYVWLDGTKHSWLKVRSSVIRLVKRAFQGAGISMPDEAREIVFPDGVPIRMVGRNANTPPPAPEKNSPKPIEGGQVSTCGEARLESDSGAIQQLAQASRTPEEGRDLLHPEAPPDR
jgi:small-conductance mechanosensitive channel